MNGNDELGNFKEFANRMKSTFEGIQTYKEEKDTYGIQYLIQFQEWKGELINEIYRFTTGQKKANLLNIAFSFLNDFTDGKKVLDNIKEMILEIQDLDAEEKDKLNTVLRNSINEAPEEHESFITDIDKVVNDVVDLIIKGRNL